MNAIVETSRVGWTGFDGCKFPAGSRPYSAGLKDKASKAQSSLCFSNLNSA